MKKLITLLLLWSAAAFGQTFPVNNLVVNGSTTLSTSTAHSLVVGQGSNAVTYSAPGTAGYALLSNGPSADPSFQSLTSASLNFIQAGSGAVSRVLQSKVREISVNVNDFGADPTGGTDSTTAIQEAINQVASLGGGYVDFGAGLYIISSTLTINASAVKLRGVGHDNNHDAGSPGTVTTVRWNGTSGGTMVVITPPASPTQRLSGNGITGIFLSSNNGLAGIGLDLYSSNWGYYDIAGDQFTTVFMRMGVDTALTAEAPDPQFNYVTLDHRNGLNNGGFLTLNGSASANTSFNYFGNLHTVLLKTANAIILNNADNNIFQTVNVFGAGSGGGVGIILAAGTGSAYARANTFEHVSMNMPVYAEGTEVNTVPSQNNQIEYWDVENAPVNVTTGTSATIFVGSNHAPIGYRTYSANVGGTSTYTDNAGTIIASGFTTQIAANSNLAITLPVAFNTGSVNVSVTPNGGTPVRFSAQCSNTTLTIYNGPDGPSFFFWRVEGR